MGGLFIGIAVDYDEAVACLATAKRIWAAHHYIQWFHPESLHCTLAHVAINGKNFNWVANTIQQAMRQTGKQHPRVKLSFNQFNWFGTHETLVLTNPYPRGNAWLAPLMHDLGQALRRYGLHADQPGQTHVSLGIRDTKSVSINTPLFNADPTAQLLLRWSAYHLTLYQTLASRTYKILSTAPLVIPKSERQAKSTSRSASAP